MTTSGFGSRVLRLTLNLSFFQGDEDANLAPQMSEGGFQFNPSGGPSDGSSGSNAPTNIEF